MGLEVGRYISLERLVEQNKDRYYETLEQSSQGWHEGKHDPWPYINYVLSILKAAYREFVERVGEISEPRGSKTQLVLEVISKMSGTFSLADLERACPGVSRDMISASPEYAEGPNGRLYRPRPWRALAKEIISVKE